MTFGTEILNLKNYNYYLLKKAGSFDPAFFLLILSPEEVAYHKGNQKSEVMLCSKISVRLF